MVKRCGFPLDDDTLCNRKVKSGECYQHRGKARPQRKKLREGRQVRQQGSNTKTSLALHGANPGRADDMVSVYSPRPEHDITQPSIVADRPSLEWLVDATRRHTAVNSKGLTPFQTMQNYHGVAALRRVAGHDALPYGVRAVFAGGTCLVLGHRIVERYSEDIDIVLVGAGTLAQAERNEVLLAVKMRLLFDPGASDVDERRGPHFIRQDVGYRRSLEPPPPQGFDDDDLFVRVDAGFADDLPARDVTTVTVETYMSLRGDNPYAASFDDLAPVEVLAVKPSVTLTEKLIALHQRADSGQRKGLIRRARDICDIGCLLQHEPTLELLSVPGSTPADIDERQEARSKIIHPGGQGARRLHVRRPEGGFADSPVWQRGHPMNEAIRDGYHSLNHIFYDRTKKPAFDDVVDLVHEHRDLL